MPIIILVGGLATGLVSLIAHSGILLPPQAIVQQYITSLYAQDYGRAYELIAATDRSIKSREAYLQENWPVTGFALEASGRLASFIEYRQIVVNQQGNRATVTMTLIVPDGNADVIREILFASPASEGERLTLLATLDQLHESGQLPSQETAQQLELVKERGRWWIVEGWAAAVRVHFVAEVEDGLPWSFEPVQETVLIRPGETLQAVYRAKNLSDQPVTGKAQHIEEPAEFVNFLRVVQCFCFIQQTLGPGEEMELPLLFYLDSQIPAEAKDLYVRYTFYPVQNGNEGGVP
jgi:hypothetical protein